MAVELASGTKEGKKGKERKGKERWKQKEGGSRLVSSKPRRTVVE